MASSKIKTLRWLWTKPSFLIVDKYSFYGKYPIKLKIQGEDMNKDLYSNPLITRYSSREMASVFSDNYKYTTWRRLWIALAEAQKDLGLNITQEQINDLKENINNIDYDYINKVEKEKKHDVMAHIDGYAKTAEKAEGIIHLGATSAFITDNTDLIQIKEAGMILFRKLLVLMKILSEKALEYKELPILGFTHFQVAQPTTVGKRFSLWLYDLYEDAQDFICFIENLKFRGTKGTVGTMASYYEIFGASMEKCIELDKKLSESFGFISSFPVTGQVYPRKTDYKLSSILSQLAQSLMKMSTDMRLLQHRREIMEPFGSSQIGSSAMPYKQNPMKSERITSLGRYLLSKPLDFANISSNQWLERTLDDSALRRIIIPESFMTADAIISLAITIIKDIKINEKIIRKNLSSYMPLLLSEKLIARMVEDNISRQEAHHRIRDISIKYIEENNLDRLLDAYFQDNILIKYKDFILKITDPSQHIGTAPMQVVHFIEKSIYPFMDKYRKYYSKEYKYEHEI